MSQQICKKCGAKLESNSKYCPNCGTLLNSQNPHPTICEDCGLEVPQGHAFCPNCGCPVESNRIPVHDRKVAVARKEKNHPVIKAFFTVTLLSILTLLVIAGGFYGFNRIYSNIQMKKQTQEVLSQAALIYDNGDYYEALQLFSSIENNPEAEDGTKRCRYQLGKSAMDSQQWNEAKAQFLSINDTEYEDTKALIKKCEEELEKIESEKRKAEAEQLAAEKERQKRAQCADDDFLRDLEAVISSRLRAGIRIPQQKTIETEYSTLQKFQNKEFYDTQLGNLASSIIIILSLQRTVSSYKDMKHYQQERISELNVELAQKLYVLYSKFDFMKDNTSFVYEYITNRQSWSDYASAIADINSDIQNSLNRNGSWQDGDYYRIYQIMQNTTKHIICIKFYFTVYTEGQSEYLFSDTYTAENVPANTNYYIYLDLYDVPSSGRITTTADWEILSVE